MSESQRRITFVEQREHVRSFVLEDKWQFKPHGRMQFLQRWAWRLLLWRGALKNAAGQTVEITRHQIDTEDVMRRLIEQRHALFSGYSREPKELLIGSEDFAQLMGHPSVQNYLEFGAQYMNDRRVMGLRVRVIPWMRGMLVMPETSNA